MLSWLEFQVSYCKTWHALSSLVWEYYSCRGSLYDRYFHLPAALPIRNFTKADRALKGYPDPFHHSSDLFELRERLW